MFRLFQTSDFKIQQTNNFDDDDKVFPVFLYLHEGDIYL